MKVCSVVGARPQFVKAGAVSRAMRKIDGLVEVMIHTGQHYDFKMSEIFFHEFALPDPKYNLGVGSASHGTQTAKMLEGLENVFELERPSCVLIYGDTNSTLAAAIAAVKLHIPVAHVEAGLRSFNRRMPEEINRIVADSVADLFFAPTEDAVSNLRREGQPPSRIVWTGDVMYDAALLSSELARSKSNILQTLKIVDKSYYLATFHRAENTDDTKRLTAICETLMRVASEHAVVLPLHPRTRAALAKADLLRVIESRVTLIEPVGYLDMVRLEMSARAVITDSGGVQKEAFFHSVPCFILRDETEWTELVTSGWNTLVPPSDPSEMARVILDVDSLRPQSIKPYGNGDASEIVARALMERYGQ